MTVLLCGTSGTGKSTLASLLAGRLGVTGVLSTDSVRHMLRAFSTPADAPLLWVSTYEAGDAFRCGGPSGRCAGMFCKPGCSPDERCCSISCSAASRHSRTAMNVATSCCLGNVPFLSRQCFGTTGLHLNTGLSGFDLQTPVCPVRCFEQLSRQLLAAERERPAHLHADILQHWSSQTIAAGGVMMRFPSQGASRRGRLGHEQARGDYCGAQPAAIACFSCSCLSPSLKIPALCMQKHQSSLRMLCCPRHRCRLHWHTGCSPTAPPVYHQRICSCPFCRSARLRHARIKQVLMTTEADYGGQSAVVVGERGMAAAGVQGAGGLGDGVAGGAGGGLRGAAAVAGGGGRPPGAQRRAAPHAPPPLCGALPHLHQVPPAAAAAACARGKLLPSQTQSLPSHSPSCLPSFLCRANMPNLFLPPPFPRSCPHALIWNPVEVHISSALSSSACMFLANGARCAAPAPLCSEHESLMRLPALAPESTSG